ncbi:MAG TPA: hypothetical protein VGK78_15330 [Nocardioides sp.]|uniref:hypothetical protein n=1 Tax=Nocardioides sp. TaxID=35761 RepID=UPI002F4040CD
MSIHAPVRHGDGVDLAEIPWRRLSGVRVGIVLWGGLAVVDVGSLAHAPAYAELGAVAVLVSVASFGVRLPTATAAALVGWLVVDGFVIHRFGVLGFDGTPDVARLAVLVVLATAAARARR